MSAFDSQARRRAIGATAALEFRVGLYQWLTRVLPSVYGKPVWVLVAFVALMLFPLYHVAVLGFAVGRVLWLAPGAVVPVWALAVFVPAELRRFRGTTASRGASRGLTDYHVLRLLPASPNGRELGPAIGRLGALVVAIATGFALMLAGAAAAYLEGRQAPSPSPLMAWVLVALALFALRSAALWLARRPTAAYMWPAGITLWLGLWWCLASAPKVMDPEWQVDWFLQRSHVWTWAALILLVGAAWVLLTLLLAGAHLVLRGVLSSRWPGRRLSLSALVDAVAWREMWGRVGVPEAGWARWGWAAGRLLGTLCAGALVLGGVACLPKVIVTPHSPGVWSFAIGFPLVCIPLAAILLVLALWPGDFSGAAPRCFVYLAPFPHRDLWRIRLCAAAVCAFACAAAGELLALAELGGALAVGAPLADLPVALFWVPVMVPAVGLLLWAQAPLLSHPFRLLRGAEWLWLILTIVAASLTGLIGFTVHPSLEVCLPGAAGLLWAAAIVQAWLSYLALDPNAWGVDRSGSPTMAAKAAFLGAACSSAIALAAMVLCCLATIGALAGGQ